MVDTPRNTDLVVGQDSRFVAVEGLEGGGDAILAELELLPVVCQDAGPYGVGYQKGIVRRLEATSLAGVATRST
jgi:hypothetical protein